MTYSHIINAFEYIGKINAICLILSLSQAQKYNDKLKAETHSTVKIFHQVTLFLNSRACTLPCDKIQKIGPMK